MSVAMLCTMLSLEHSRSSVQILNQGKSPSVELVPQRSKQTCYWPHYNSNLVVFPKEDSVTRRCPWCNKSGFLMLCQVHYKIPKIPSAGKGLDPLSAKQMTQCLLFSGHRSTHSNERQMPQQLSCVSFCTVPDIQLSLLSSHSQVVGSEFVCSSISCHSIPSWWQCQRWPFMG